MNEIVRVKSAPGLKWKKRDGYFEARWQCRDDLVKRPDFDKFKIKSVKLWSGSTDPTKEEWDFISDTCTQLQQEMLVWARGGLPTALTFDGTLAGLILCYRNDPDSNYRKKEDRGGLRYASRVHYDAIMSMLERDKGDELIANFKGRTFQHLYDAWSAESLSVAHAKIKILRILFNFGATLLEDAECIRLASVLSGMRFKMPKPRVEHMTAEQAIAIRAKAHEMGRSSIALAQAFQFELMLRQKDVLGEWVPLTEPGMSDTIADGMKWLRGLRWEEIDQNLTLVHVTSKRQKKITVSLKNAPMICEELNLKYPGTVRHVEIMQNGKPVIQIVVDRSLLPTSGPSIISEYSKVPWEAPEFRRWWRKVADAAGVPETVRNMDSRAGAISEAVAAGAKLEHIRHGATHSDISMTQRYDRGAEEAIEMVQKLRTESRNKPRTK